MVYNIRISPTFCEQYILKKCVVLTGGLEVSFSIEANSVDPEQTAPIWFTLFAIEAS